MKYFCPTDDFYAVKVYLKEIKNALYDFLSFQQEKSTTDNNKYAAIILVYTYIPVKKGNFVYSIYSSPIMKSNWISLFS